MLIKTLVFLVVFGGVFYLANYFFPFFKSGLGQWQQKRMEKITPKVDRMFLDVPLKKLMLIDSITPLAAGLVGYILSRSLIVAGAGVGVGLVLPFLIIRKMEEARRKLFVSQLIDALGIISSSLKAGLSLLQSFEEVMTEMPAPISQEFGLLVRQMQMGVSLEEAITSLKNRIRVDELDVVVTALLVARDTGGELTETFGRLAFTLQERNKLQSRVNALCVQAKLQGVIMSIIPIAFGAFVYFMVDPHFFDTLMGDPVGRILLMYAVVSEILGIFFIRKFSRIDI
jgi:tight adherence protein B